MGRFREVKNFNAPGPPFIHFLKILIYRNIHSKIKQGLARKMRAKGFAIFDFHPSLLYVVQQTGGNL